MVYMSVSILSASSKTFLLVSILNVVGTLFVVGGANSKNPRDQVALRYSEAEILSLKYKWLL